MAASVWQYGASKKIILLLLTAVLLCGPIPAQAAEAVTSKKVLILYSYDAELPVQRLFTGGLQSRLAQNTSLKVAYMYEYLDMARYPDNRDYSATLSRFLKEKYAANRPDLIITHFGPAGNFMTSYGEQTFPGVPAVLGLYEGEGEKYPEPPANYRDVVGTYGIKNAIGVILQAQPNTKKIYVVAGDSERERQGVAALAENTAAFADRLEFVYLNNLPFDQIVSTVQNISGDAAILFLYFFRDVAGNYFVPGDALQRLYTVARVPIYSSVSVFIGRGTIGGYMSSQEMLGAKAAEVGADILQGNMAAHLPVDKMVAAEYIFDWRELKRWGIDERRLPAGSRIEYRQAGIWETNRREIIAGVLIVFAQTLLIALLLSNRKRRRQSEAALRELNANLGLMVADRTTELQTTNASLEEEIMERIKADAHIRSQAELLDLANDFILVRDLDSRITYWNKGAESGYGFTAEEAIGQVTHSLLRTVFPDSSVVVMETLEHRGHWEGELVHTRKTGEQLIVMSHQVLRRDVLGKPEVILEINRNITAAKEAAEARRKSEARYYSLFNNMQDFFVLRKVITDDAGRPVDLEYVEINAAYERYIGVGTVDIKGLRWTEKAPWIKSEHPDWVERLGQVALTGRATHFEEYSQRSGKYMQIIAYCPEPGYVANIAVDITDRVVAQQKLQEINASMEEEIAERQAAQEALRQLNATLEDVVAERTAQLEDINATLEEEIAERQAAQETLVAQRNTLVASEARYRGLFQHMENFFAYFRVIVDEIERPVDLEYVEVNSALERIIGLKAADLVGQRITAINPLIEHEAVNRIQVFGRVAVTGEPVAVEFYSQQYGRYFRVSAYSPEPGYVATVGEDITARKNAEEVVRESQEWYEAIMQQSSDGIAIIDFDTKRIVEINRAFARMFGYSAAEVIGMPAVDSGLLTPGEIVEIDAALTVSGSWSAVAVRRYPRQDGSVLYAEVAATQMSHRGKKLEILSYRDVAEQHKLQAEIQHQVELAGTLQKSLLSPDYQNEKLTIRTIFEPATLVSGDFYGYRWFHDGNILHGYLIDVTGHGVAAALHTSAVSSLLNEIMDAEEAWTPETLSKLNRYLNGYLPANSFVALMAFTLDLRQKRLSCSACGINYVLVATKARKELVAIRGLYLGAAEEPIFEKTTFPVSAGDSFYFMTDGIYDVLPKNAAASADDFEATVEYLRNIALQGRNEDDCSALCIKIGDSGGDLPLSLAIERAEELERLQEMAGGILGKFAGDDSTKLKMVLGEALMNAAKYGTSIRVKINKIGGHLVVRVKDDGPGFNGNAKIHEYRSVGLAAVFAQVLHSNNGRGIAIMMAWTDKMLYNAKGNEVMLIKKLVDIA